jgi:hypothetical protein
MWHCAKFLSTAPRHTHKIAIVILGYIWNCEIFHVSISTLKVPASAGSMDLMDMHAQCITIHLTRCLKQKIAGALSVEEFASWKHVLTIDNPPEQEAFKAYIGIYKDLWVQKMLQTAYMTRHVSANRIPTKIM